jgi:hypothetical protein
MNVKEMIEELSKIKNEDALVYINYGDKLEFEESVSEIEPQNYYGYTRKVIIK